MCPDVDGYTQGADQAPFQSTGEVAVSSLQRDLVNHGFGEAQYHGFMAIHNNLMHSVHIYAIYKPLFNDNNIHVIKCSYRYLRPGGWKYIPLVVAVVARLSLVVCSHTSG
jgi:hypothetical protein